MQSTNQNNMANQVSLHIGSPEHGTEEAPYYTITLRECIGYNKTENVNVARFGCLLSEIHPGIPQAERIRRLRNMFNHEQCTFATWMSRKDVGFEEVFLPATIRYVEHGGAAGDHVIPVGLVPLAINYINPEQRRLYDDKRTLADLHSMLSQAIARHGLTDVLAQAHAQVESWITILAHERASILSLKSQLEYMRGELAQQHESIENMQSQIETFKNMLKQLTEDQKGVSDRLEVCEKKVDDHEQALSKLSKRFEEQRREFKAYVEAHRNEHLFEELKSYQRVGTGSKRSRDVAFGDVEKQKKVFMHAMQERNLKQHRGCFAN